MHYFLGGNLPISGFLFYQFPKHYVNKFMLFNFRTKMVFNISYCPPNITIWEVWVDHGTSQCFMDTITSSVIAAFILVAGIIQLCMYRKYGTEVSPNHVTKSKLYRLQIFFTLFLPIIEIVRFSLQASLLNNKSIYGYMVRYLLYQN